MKSSMEGNDQTLIRELLTGKNVLIVDDDNDYAEALDEVFSLQGCNVTRISDPVAAMDQINEKEYDLMIVDKNMPKMDGLDFACRVRAKKPASKIVMITAYPNEESRKRSLEAGIRYYLSKPFRKNDILEIATFVLL
ncbi:MAG: response regulator [bacterium]|jgi:DNA-binding response OmpR family regulator